MSLVIRSLSKTFGGVEALKNINLDVSDGEFFSLLGPSGCGKTTLLRSIAGIYEPDSGEIMLNDRALCGRAMSERNTALVFQNYALFPHLSVFENVSFGLKMRRQKPAEIARRVGEAIELVHLSGFESRYPGQLSGGQQQRVALARALVVEPDLLLLDEPLSNLDAKLRETMRHEVREIQKSVGITTILVTHDIQEAFAMSDRIAVMSAGRIEQIGTPEEIYSAPSTMFTAEFTGQINRFSGRVVDLEADRAVLETEGGLRISFRPVAGETKQGEDATLMIRPERVRVDVEADGLPNRMEATLESATYLGSMIIYRLRVGGTEVSAQAANVGRRPPAAGAPISVGWDEHDTFFQR
ncbi:ABC transporter ATP-binding protein [Pikeienuella piscinae]|uniref:ABC transporter ATP-binding protein n=1 Tax=Pikeienuella piscinae TaxID=2748098 RepID=A0A7L5BZW4_9RHOB|nr:ABC transporter ATP-binding protein [Pikeienuella piscinae]QIE56057.1 ABC transporter ATP-binding protein [Pikeienuella piscinae]